MAAANWHRDTATMPEPTVTAAAESGPRAFTTVGLTRADAELVMLCHACTINTILFLEDLDFCPKEEGGRFVQEGHVAPGRRPLLRASGHVRNVPDPGGGDAAPRPGGGRQVRKCGIALLHGDGGTLSSRVTALLGTAVALE